MVFNQQRFEQALATVPEPLSGLCLPQGIGIHWFTTLPSTNQTLWQLLEQGATFPTVVIAGQQTAGRGQWGRQWQSQAGGLYLSLAIAPNLPASNSAQLTLSSAWGIATALRAYDIPVFLKWPNDLLLLGRKLGGILTETRVHQGQITKAVVGVGVNSSNTVPEPGINLQTFFAQQSSSTVISLEGLAAIVLQGLLWGYQCGSQDMEAVLPSYLTLLANQGDTVVINGISGIITGITPNGELRVCLSPDTVNTASANGVRSPLPTEIVLRPGTISLGYRR